MVESDYENINIESNKYQKIEWLTEKDLSNSPISTAMKKVFKLDSVENSKVRTKIAEPDSAFNSTTLIILKIP